MKKSFTFLLSLTCLTLTAFTQNTALDLTGTNYVTTNGPDVINNSGDFTIGIAFDGTIIMTPSGSATNRPCL